MAKKRVLGKGLSEIFGEVQQAYENHLGGGSESVVEIEIDRISPNPYQPRKIFDSASLQELSYSIQEYGLLQPILVYEEENRYVLIAGERRLRASKLIGSKTIKAIIVEMDLSKLREVALIENIQREDLNPIDLAKAYEELLLTYRLTHEELAKRIQKSRAQITNTLRLLQLTSDVQQMLTEGKITQGHAKILVALDGEQQEKIAHSIVGQKLSVREVEKIVQQSKNAHRSLVQKKPSEQLLDSQTEEMIRTILGKHQIDFAFAGGQKISISLKSEEQIQRFLDLITKQI